MGKQQGNDEFSVKAKALVEKMRGYDFSDDEIKDALRKLKKKSLSEPTLSSSSQEPTPSSEATTTSESVGEEPKNDLYADVEAAQSAQDYKEPIVEVPNRLVAEYGRQGGDGSSVPRDASDFKATQEKDTAFERQFGKNEFTDFFGDLYRAWDAGTEAGASVNEAFDIYKGEEATDEEVYDFLEKSRKIEEKGQTDEMIAFSEKQAQLKKEGYNGVSAFFLGWWDNPSAMLQYSAQSLSQMGRAFRDSEEVYGTATAAAGVGAATGAAIGLAGGPFAPITSTAGAITGSISGFLGGLSGAMETAMTTATLIQEKAVEEGLDWATMSDKKRFDYIRKLQNNEEEFNDLKSKAASRGLAIGAIDAITAGVTGGAGSAASRTVAKGARSSLAGAARVGTVASVETGGGMLSEVAGQAAAKQKYNLEEILIEGFADKTFTGVSIIQSLSQGAPKYSINGEKMNGKQFIDNIKILDDEVFFTDNAIKVENSPAVEKLISNRRENIEADQYVDSRISDVTDRTTAINLVKEQNRLKNNPTGNKTRLTQIKSELDGIAAKYADSQVDATIEKRKEAVANAVANSFEASFNKNYKAPAETETKETPVKEDTDKNLEGELIGEQAPTKVQIIPEGGEKVTLEYAFKGNTDLGYHGGTLGDRTDYLTSHYRGEQPWTGYYFYSKADNAISRGHRGRKGENNKYYGVVDFSKYNLLEPTTKQYWAVKSKLKSYETKLRKGEDISSVTESIREYMPELADQISDERIAQLFQEWETAEREKRKDGSTIREHFPTVVLKDLGYEGVDVRGLKEKDGMGSPDKGTEGSVIFDLKEGTVKRFKTKSQQESQVQPDVTATEGKDVVTPEILEQGKKEVTDVTKGTFSTANPVKIFKGIGGKKDLQGFRINAHKGAKGVFSSVDSELAATYGRDEGVAEVVIPKGTSIEVVEVDGTGMGMSDYRAAEVKAINNSDAQIVKLITIDGVMRAGEKRQQQYVIKDDSLIEGLKKEESPTSTKDKVSTQKKAETRDDSEGNLTETTQESKVKPKGKIRGFAEREAEVVGRELGDREKAKILSNPENYYEPQVLKDIKDDMADMTDEDLVSQMTEEGLMSAKEGDGNTAGLAAAELINRRLADGKGIDDIVEVIAKKGTKAGQFLRQLAEVKGSTPLGIYSYIQKELDKRGLEIPTKNKQELLNLSKKYIDDVSKWKEALKEVRENPTENNELKEIEAQMAVAESFKPLNTMILDLTPRSIWDSMGLAVQGNLLTPMSQATNIFANAIQLPIRGTVEAIAGIADAVNSFVTNSPRVNMPSIGGYVRGGKEVIPSLKKSFNEIVSGQISDIAKGEIQRGFRPYRGLLQVMGKAPLPINKKTGKKSGKVSAAFEALFGAPPQIMFALLRLGDNLFRMPVRARALYEYGQIKGLSGSELENFIKYPDEKSLARAEERSKEAVYMEESTISNLAVGFMNNLSRGIDSTIGKVPIIGKTFAGIARLVIKLSVPYVKTPANIVSQTIDLALPVLPAAKSAIYFRVANKALNGNKYSEASESEKSAYTAAKRKANIEFGKSVTGMMMVGAAAWLVSKGLVSEGIDDDTEKESNLKYATFPPNSINISGIIRAMNGGSPSPKPNDTFISLSKTGLFGMVAGIYAKVNKADIKSELKKPEGETKAEEYSRYIEQYSLIPQSIIGFATEQSFLAGINSLLKAVSDGKYEDWFKNTFKAVTSIALPNTLAAINRAQREFLPDLRSNNIFEQLKNVILDKTWNTEDLPIRVDYFGRNIRQTPEERNPWVYQLIDVTKSRTMTDDPVDNEIFNLYRETHDSRVIPNLKKRRVEEDGKYLGDMTPEQYREINKKLGEARYRAIDKLIKRPFYIRADFGKKADLIADAYKKASKDKEYAKVYYKIKKEIRRR